MPNGKYMKKKSGFFLDPALRARSDVHSSNLHHRTLFTICIGTVEQFAVLFAPGFGSMTRWFGWPEFLSDRSPGGLAGDIPVPDGGELVARHRLEVGPPGICGAPAIVIPAGPRAQLELPTLST